MSYHFWQQSLSSDAAVLGKTIRLTALRLNVIGVMPKSFHGIKQELEPPDLWTPMTMQTVMLKQPSMLTPGDGVYFLRCLWPPQQSGRKPISPHGAKPELA